MFVPTLSMIASYSVIIYIFLSYFHTTLVAFITPKLVKNDSYCNNPPLSY